MNPNARRLAALFCTKLRQWLTPDQMAEVIRLNNAEADASICHSHDFCDANAAMLEAWHQLLGNDAVPSFIDGGTGEQRSRDLALWSEAWELAKDGEFISDQMLDLDSHEEIDPLGEAFRKEGLCAS